MTKWAPPYDEGPKVVSDYYNNGRSGYALVTADGNNVKVDLRVLTNGAWKTFDSFSYDGTPRSRSAS